MNVNPTREQPPLSPGQKLVLEPTQLVAGGASLSRVEGYPIFVAGLYPGDQALVEIIEVKRGFARGEVVELQTPSAERRVEPCPIAGECGGCDWTSLRLDVQLRWKQSILLDSLRRIGKIQAADHPPIRIHPSPLNYRLRSRLHRGASDPPSIGFYALKSNEVVPLSDRCEVVGPEVVLQIPRLAAHLARSGATSIETFESRGRLTAAPVADDQRGAEVEIAVRGFDYRLSTSAFFQVNRHLLATMIDLITAHVARVESRRVAWDLFAGVGFFTLPLARVFERVVSVEESLISHRFARINVRQLSNVQTSRSRVEDFLQRSDVEVDFIVVDPPRAGLTPEVIEDVSKTSSRLMSYFSCDPVTLARDVSRLARRGWRIHSLDLLDLFPNTHHIETLVGLER